MLMSDGDNYHCVFVHRVNDVEGKVAQHDLTRGRFKRSADTRRGPQSFKDAFNPLNELLTKPLLLFFVEFNGCEKLVPGWL